MKQDSLKHRYTQKNDGSIDSVDVLSGLPSAQEILPCKRRIRSKSLQADVFSYLNPLRASQIQLVTQSELEWIYACEESDLQSAPAFSSNEVAMLLLCEGCRANPAMLSICEKNQIGIVQTNACPSDVMQALQVNLPRLLRARVTEHGVFLAVKNTGVLLTGVSGIGKSEVALDLVQRGHQLVADDAVQIHRTASGELMGECPEMLRGYLEIRGLGIINILQMFGPSSVLDRYRLQLIINFVNEEELNLSDIDRLRASLHDQKLLDINIPCLSMMVAPGRNLSVLVEAAVRDHLLREAGIDSSVEFLSQHDQYMQESDDN